MADNTGLAVVGGIFLAIVILIFVHWALSKSHHKTATHHEKALWQLDHERRLKNKRIKEFANTTARDTLNRFKPEPFLLNKKKITDYPTIKCLSCDQTFHCEWKDPQLVVHEEQELTRSKDWKGFEQISE